MEIPLFQGNLGWWNIIIWPDSFTPIPGEMIQFDLKKINWVGWNHQL